MRTQSRRAPVSDAVGRRLAARAYLRRWAEGAGAQLLVVDPTDDESGLVDAMAGHGVHVTWVADTLDGLVAFGRINPHAVVIAPEAPGIPADDFVGRIRLHGSPYVIASGGDHGKEHRAESEEIGPLMLAGAAAVIFRPYAPQQVWDLMTHAPRSVADHAKLEVGPIELDASAFTVRLGGERIADLPLKEFELLRALMLSSPGVVTDEELRDAIWGTSGRRPGGNTIAMHVARLRSRLGDTVVVRRVRGRGYSLTVDPT